jgi:hypothetical protein
VRDELFRRIPAREVRHAIEIPVRRGGLANHSTQATERPADVRNRFFEKQQLPGPIYR